MPAKRNAREQDRLAVSRPCLSRAAPSKNRSEDRAPKRRRKEPGQPELAMVPGRLSKREVRPASLNHCRS